MAEINLLHFRAAVDEDIADGLDAAREKDCRKALTVPQAVRSDGDQRRCAPITEINRLDPVASAQEVLADSGHRHGQRHMSQQRAFFEERWRRPGEMRVGVVEVDRCQPG